MTTIKIWRKRLLTPQYGYDRLIPTSPSTLKVEHHDPGGLVWWEDLAEIVLNLFCLLISCWVATMISPAFGGIWAFVSLLGLFSSRLRFRFFERRPSSITIRYEPANIPPELVQRYEVAHADFDSVLTELEELAAAQGLH